MNNNSTHFTYGVLIRGGYPSPTNNNCSLLTLVRSCKLYLFH